MDRRSKHIDQYTLKSLSYDELLKDLRLFRSEMGGRYLDKMIGDHYFKLIEVKVDAAL